MNKLDHSIKYKDAYKIIKDCYLNKNKLKTWKKVAVISDQEFEEYYKSEEIEPIKSDEEYKNIAERLEDYDAMSIVDLSRDQIAGWLNTVIVYKAIIEDRIWLKSSIVAAISLVASIFLFNIQNLFTVRTALILFTVALASKLISYATIFAFRTTKQNYKKAASIVRDFERYVKYNITKDEIPGYTEAPLKEVFGLDDDLLNDISLIQKNLVEMFIICNTRREIRNPTIEKILELKEIIKNKEVLDNQIKNEIEAFVRKYGTIINSTALSITKSEDYEKADKLTGYVYDILNSICDKHKKSKESNTNIELNTLENLMKLDGYRKEQSRG